MEKVNVYWFRKALRFHDNEPLLEACNAGIPLIPIFIFDPLFLPNSNEEHSATGSTSGHKQFLFLLECLEDLNNKFEAFGSQLLIYVNRKPNDVFEEITTHFDIETLYFEKDTEPYAIERDALIENMMNEKSIQIHSTWAGHTLQNMDFLTKKFEKCPKQYRSFLKVIQNTRIPLPVETVQTVPDLPDVSTLNGVTTVPTLCDLGFSSDVNENEHSPFYGGESLALERLEMHLENKQWIATFEKPKTNPATLQPSTTALSPYITLGCLSVRYFYHKVNEVYKKRKHASPPQSLHGQLYFREWFYYLGYTVPNFDKMEGNDICLQADWNRDPEIIQAFREGRTGYPWIDAIMRQLRTEGWIHHLARHAVACFFTRGQLWQHWEEGRDIFADYLLDGDWSLNAANWMWLSASAFFTAYFRVYGTESFPKKYDKQGIYVKQYCPELAKFPAKYIYKPWEAPLAVQKEAGCIIGKDYPMPIVNEKEAKAENMAKMKEAYRQKKLYKKSGNQTNNTTTISRKKRSNSNKKPAAKIKKQQKGKKRKQEVAEPLKKKRGKKQKI